MNCPRPEHPNPQFEREHWINLNGAWEFEIDTGNSGRDRKLFCKEHLKDQIVVPFCPESKLSTIEYKDFMSAVWYKKEFTVPPDWAGQRILLHFGAVDYRAFVYVNEKLAGTHQGGYSSFALDITAYIAGENNSIVVCAEDDVRSPLQPRGKQSEGFYSERCDYTRTTGIWQTVWLECVPHTCIQNVHYETDVQQGVVTIHSELQGAARLSAKVFYNDVLQGEASVASTGGHQTLTVSLCERHLWEPGAGRLYDVILQYGEDTVKSYFGLRSVYMDALKCRINGASVFQRLVLDQGFYPDGIYTAPNEEAIIRDIQISLDAGFNGARLHQKIFEPRFLYHCDRMGYMVWGEYPCWGIDVSDPRSLERILPEWIEAVLRDRNHPSIIGWCPLNETWDYQGRAQDDDMVRCLYRATKAIDPTRPCIDTSGFYHVETDVYDVHDYEQDAELFKEHYGDFTKKEPFEIFPKRQKYCNEPFFVSEYGGILWNVDGVDDGWGYGDGPKSEEEFLARYQALTDTLLDNPQIFAFCYTQLYDVEQEKNGLYTYEREPKFPMQRIREVNIRRAKIEE